MNGEFNDNLSKSISKVINDNINAFKNDNESEIKGESSDIFNRMFIIFNLCKF